MSEYVFKDLDELAKEVLLYDNEVHGVVFFQGDSDLLGRWHVGSFGSFSREELVAVVRAMADFVAMVGDDCAETIRCWERE